MASRAWVGLLAGLWAGVLLAIALGAAPAAFALLDRADAGRVVGRLFAQEAYLSLLLGAVVLLVERRVGSPAARSLFTPNLLLALGALFCTVAGYFALQPVMESARAGRGALSFGQLHAVSTAFYGLKTVLVLGLAWRGTAR